MLKVGNWSIVTFGEQPSVRQIKQVIEDVDGVMYDVDFSIHIPEEFVTPWVPLEDEWCFCDDLGLVKIVYVDSVLDHYLCLPYHELFKNEKKFGRKLSALEPFFGPLPTFLQS